MNKKNISFSSIEDQIKKLKENKLIITDESNAKTMLKTYGYSNLIKSYRYPYVIKENGKKIYKDGVTFEQISSLYFLIKL
ncbi:MAG: hypothetical protein IJ167_05075 [Lachnospiraceae bacterium]|nr:hypothetical protein [Lachnospiraceae bacterium]